MGPSAALTPAIWEKTIPYDGENFHLEYMDLEEFLMENGIPASPDEDSLKSSTEGDVEKTEKLDAAPSAETKTAGVSAVALLPIQELDKCEEEVVIITKSDSDITSDVTAGEWFLFLFVHSHKSTKAQMSCSRFHYYTYMYLFGLDVIYCNAWVISKCYSILK